MSLIDSIRNVFKNTKSASFSVSSRSSWQDYSTLTDSDNYFDQFFGWTYKAIKTVCDSTVRHDIHLAKGTEDKYDIVKRSENDLLRDLNRFNPYQTLSEARWITRAQKRLVGMAYWLIVSADEKPYRYEFYILDPTKMSMKVNSFGLPKVYQYRTPDGGLHDIAPEDLIIHKDPNPADWLRGYSVLQASRFSHNSYELAMRFNMNVFGNMGTPEGFLVFDGISKVQRKKTEKLLRQKYGSVKNAGKVGVLGKLAQWLPITTAPRDLQFKENILLMRDEILSFHGVPKPLVGLTDSTYTNSFEAQKIFQMYTLEPELKQETDVFNEQLIAKYYRTAIPKDLFFICPDPVEADTESVTNQAVAQYSAGIIKLNEARKMVNQTPDEENGNQYRQQTISDFTPSSTEPEAPVKTIKKKVKKSKLVGVEKEEGERLKAFFLEKSLKNEKIYEARTISYFEDQSRRIRRQLNPKKAVDGVDVSFIFDPIAEAKYAEDYFEDVVGLIARNALRTSNQIINQKNEIPEHIKNNLRDGLRRFAEEINSTTQKDLARIIEDSINNGESYNQTAKKIKDLFDNYSHNVDPVKDSRAKMIAVTETNSIVNEVYRGNYFQSEIVKGMQWLTAHDTAVRHAHAEADYTIAGKGQKFYVGGEYLTQPGDKNGSASNVINCRCTIIPVIK